MKLLFFVMIQRRLPMLLFISPTCVFILFSKFKRGLLTHYFLFQRQLYHKEIVFFSIFTSYKFDFYFMTISWQQHTRKTFLYWLHALPIDLQVVYFFRTQACATREVFKSAAHCKWSPTSVDMMCGCSSKIQVRGAATRSEPDAATGVWLSHQ